MYHPGAKAHYVYPNNLVPWIDFVDCRQYHFGGSLNYYFRPHKQNNFTLGITYLHGQLLKYRYPEIYPTLPVGTVNYTYKTPFNCLFFNVGIKQNFTKHFAVFYLFGAGWRDEENANFCLPEINFCYRF